MIREIVLCCFAGTICGQAPLEKFVFVPPGSLTGNSGAPYSADEIHEQSKPDASGKLIAEPPRARHIYRDSLGRTRTETPVSHSNLRVAEIEDPVGGFKIVLDPQARVAHRCVGSDQALGTRIIEGLTAVGTRSTVQLKSGPSITDLWKIPELSVIALAQTTLPRSGVSTTRLQNIRRAEPAPELFTIPSDYAVMDETGTFSFTIVRR